MTDRGLWFVPVRVWLNVRRLMYQSLIWLPVAGNDAGGMRPSLDAEDLQGQANALVDGMRRDLQLGRDFLRVEVLVDEEKAVQLAGAQSGDALSHDVLITRAVPVLRHVMRPFQIIQVCPHAAQHAVLPSRVTPLLMAL
jgi:hypothetical protein